MERSVDRSAAPVTVDVHEELKALRREVGELRRANEILRNGQWVFFAGGGGRPPTAVIVDYIDAYRNKFGVDPICHVLTEHGIKIAPSTYYAAKGQGPDLRRPWADAYAANTVFDLWGGQPAGLRGAQALARR